MHVNICDQKQKPMESLMFSCSRSLRNEDESVFTMKEVLLVLSARDPLSSLLLLLYKWVGDFL